MKVKIGGHEVSFYDDISLMPVTRFQKWQKMLLVDGGIGSDIQSFDRHAARIIGYIHRGEGEKAVSEVEALRQGVIMAMKCVDTSKMSTLLMVSEVDGKPWTDDTDDGLSMLSEMLSGATAGEMGKARAEAKKKSTRSSWSISRIRSIARWKKRTMTLLRSLSSLVPVTFWEKWTGTR